MMQIRPGLVIAALGLALAALVPGSVRSVGLGIEVTPGKLEVSIPAGASFNIPITVRNSSFDPVHVQASMSDFGVGTDGGYQFDKVGSRPYSLMRWAAIKPREFDVPAGSAQEVQLTLQVPQDASLAGEYAGIVFFQTRPPRHPGNAVAFSIRVAAKFYETIPGTVQLSGAITKMTADSSPRGETYKVSFKNTGNTHVYLRGQLTIQKGTSVVDTIALAGGELVERGGQRILEVRGKHLDPGSYQAIATVDYGGKTETGGEIAFDVH
jgi:hypothetical protein